jgi:hypothetical protein
MTRGRVSVQKVTSRFQDKDEEGRQVLGARGGGRREEGGGRTGVGERIE